MFYNKSSEEVLKELESSTDGLSEAQVTDHREKYGENKLQEKKKKTLLVFLQIRLQRDYQKNCPQKYPFAIIKTKPDLFR